MVMSLLEGLLVLTLASILPERAPSAPHASGARPAARTVGSLVEQSESRISALSPDRVMLQVEVDCDESSVFLAASKATPRFPVSIVPVSLKNRRCFRVLVGDFADERTALESIPLFPPGLLASGDRPRVISIGSLGVRVPSPARSPITTPVSEGAPRPAPPVSAISPPPTVVSTTREGDGEDVAPALPPAEPTPVPTIRVAVPRVTPVITPVPAPTSAPAPSPVGRVSPTPASVVSLQDFARTTTFRKAARKGSLSVVESGPGAPPPERGKAGPRSEPRISTITKDGPDSLGMIWVSGLVKNSGDAAACTIGVALTLLGPDGRVLGSARAEAAQERLNPGESTPFRGAIVPATPILVPVRPHAEITTFTECP